MSQISTFPQISTRGHYDLWGGYKLDRKHMYTLYPKKKFDKIKKAEEIVIFVHGMRNSRWGGKRGALTLRQTLRKLGYKKHPVVAFSYDADVRGAHIDAKYHDVLYTASTIAEKNGTHLKQFIEDVIKHNPKVKIHLVGHSLGCEVVTSSLHTMDVCSQHEDHRIASVHLFGSPSELWEVEMLGKHHNIINYYNPTDDVIIEGVDRGACDLPSCLVKKIPNVKTVKLLAEHHGFRAYAKVLRKFP